jgi:hypothetical protein
MSASDDLPVYSEDQFDFLAESMQELADIAKGIFPPNLKFGPLRKATIDKALLELQFQRLGTSFVRDLNAFNVSIELMRTKDNKGFSIDVGLHPLVMWDEAVHADYPLLRAPFRGRVELPGRRNLWRHALDEANAREVLSAAAGYLRANLISELEKLIDYCDTATPASLSELPPWLGSFFRHEAEFARFRMKAGREAEAKAFAAAFLEANDDPSPLARLREPRPVDLEMRRILEA